jgi:hypothetical protein
MTWLLWRQHRSLAFVAGALLGLFALAVLVTGAHMADDYTAATRQCSVGADCILVHLFNGDGAIIDIVHLSVVVPVALGVFVGATLIARETEQATNVLVWTQTVTRRRWLLGKVSTAMAFAAVVSVGTSVLVTWWSGTLNRLNGDRFEGVQFDTQNLTPVAFALFATALGIAMGALVRRSLPAIAATVGAYVAVRLLVALYLRPSYLHATSTVGAASARAGIPPGSWTLSTSIIDPAGHVVTGSLLVPPGCGSVDRGAVEACLGRLGYRTVASFLRAFFDRALRSIEELPLKPLLTTIGVDVMLRPAESSSDRGGKPSSSPPRKLAERVTLGVRTADDPDGVRLTHVLDAGPAQAAGLSAGDVIVAVDGFKASAKNLEKQLARFKAGDKVAVHAFRRDELLQVQIELRASPLDTCALVVSGSDRAAANRRRAWLRGRDT